MKNVSHYVRLLLFAGAVCLAGMSILERFINLFGYTILKAQYTPWRLLEFSAIALLFLIALQLKEIHTALTKADK